ncbi:MAG TPA: hypothetical protein VKK81_10550 [Candidatus Binatia bacterium]|nr:hypothetical protein [Candidatus Binatia bacterium]
MNTSCERSVKEDWGGQQPFVLKNRAQVDLHTESLTGQPNTLTTFYKGASVG